MSTIICGSIAFDTIMNFPGRFAEQILPDQLHILNVSFYLPTLRRDFGGCAGNIAYGLKLLGGTPLPLATVGIDGGDYLARFQALGISTDYVRTIDGAYTAQAMIITDQDNNQITGFHPGAMDQAHTVQVPTDRSIQLGIVSPDGLEAMLQHARQFKEAGIPFVFDPGQQLPRFDGEALRDMIDLATWVTVNDYEGKMLCERTGWNFDDVSRRVRGLVVTLGAEGSAVWEDGIKVHVPVVPTVETLDPTGCGDAFRAGLLYGLSKGWSLARSAELGSHMGSLKIAQRGPQNYQLNATVQGLL
jgi:adenosine kinase